MTALKLRELVVIPSLASIILCTICARFYCLDNIYYFAAIEEPIKDRLNMLDTVAPVCVIILVH